VSNIDSSSGSEMQVGEVSLKVLVETFYPAVPSVMQDLHYLCHCWLSWRVSVDSLCSLLIL